MSLGELTSQGQLVNSMQFVGVRTGTAFGQPAPVAQGLVNTDESAQVSDSALLTAARTQSRGMVQMARVGTAVTTRGKGAGGRLA